MFERTARFYGKESAANEKPNDPNLDSCFVSWGDDMAEQMNLQNEDYITFWSFINTCWESGYSSYMKGEFI